MDLLCYQKVLERATFKENGASHLKLENMKIPHLGDCRRMKLLSYLANHHQSSNTGLQLTTYFLDFWKTSKV